MELHDNNGNKYMFYRATIDGGLSTSGNLVKIPPTYCEQAAEIEKLKILLGEARCSNCYGDGANYDSHGEIHQCQWCDETKKILEANNETT